MIATTQHSAADGTKEKNVVNRKALFLHRFYKHNLEFGAKVELGHALIRLSGTLVMQFHIKTARYFGI